MNSYAISEKDDGITGVTMLIRMMGRTGIYWVATGLYWILLGFAGL